MRVVTVRSIKSLPKVFIPFTSVADAEAKISKWRNDEPEAFKSDTLYHFQSGEVKRWEIVAYSVEKGGLKHDIS